MEVDFARIAINFASIVITIGMLYYALRLMVLFRTGLLGKSWRNISTGIILLSIGGVAFFIRSVSQYLAIYGIYDLMSFLGALISLAGGALILMGLRAEFKIWINFKEEKEPPSATTKPQS